MHIQLLLPLALLPLQIFSLPVPQPQEQGLNPLPNDSDFATKSVNGVITAFGSSGKKAKRGRRTKVRRVAIVDSDVVLEERQENPIPNDSDFPTKVVNGEIVPFKKEKRQENPIPNDSDFPTKVVNGEIVPFKKEKRQENPIPNDSDFPTKVVNGEIVPFKKEKRQENPIPNDSDFPTKVVNGEIVPCSSFDSYSSSKPD
ncbi:hypothetical protein BT69DRAFT_37826 [Atractiella rhizophila]|nr:hypothetical protein BT69DRAFT_37826 [Atractiella rhizophila]